MQTKAPASWTIAKSALKRIGPAMPWTGEQRIDLPPAIVLGKLGSTAGAIKRLQGGSDYQTGNKRNPPSSIIQPRGQFFLSRAEASRSRSSRIGKPAEGCAFPQNALHKGNPTSTPDTTGADPHKRREFPTVAARLTHKHTRCNYAHSTGAELCARE